MEQIFDVYMLVKM